MRHHKCLLFALIAWILTAPAALLGFNEAFNALYKVVWVYTAFALLFTIASPPRR